ncbi:MAG: DUF4838 domain-containing protein [Lentisphaerae bacterium]|nr:DUF4838 domain-containing protein [Lentisphaerota bacterium]
MIVKKIITFILFNLAAVSIYAAAPALIDMPSVRRSIKTGGTVQEFATVKVAVAKNTPLLRYAVRELIDALQSAGISVQNIQPDTAVADGELKIVLGGGADLSQLPPEGFIIRKQGNTVYIAGKDSEVDDPAQNRWCQWYNRGTLTGVYDFLERFAGVRFYFPGKVGTYIPRRNTLQLPGSIDIFDSPDMRLRSWSHYPGKYPAGEDGKLNGVERFNVQLLRLRGSEYAVPICHGLNALGLMRRFGKTHPEYFALMTNGKRYNDPRQSHPGQICFSSGVIEEIYQDMASALRGEPASKRGVLAFASTDTPMYDPYRSFNVNMFCIMPQDYMYWCGCSQCAAIAPAGHGLYENPEQARKVSNFIWQLTADMANRLQKENIPGFIVQMVYPPYNYLPEFDLPDNLRLIVSMTGTPEVAGKRLIEWSQKCRQPLMIWTYPGKHMAKVNFDGIPAWEGKRAIKFYQQNRRYIAGITRECETDYRFFAHLDDYLYSKWCWNHDTDMEALQDEYYSLMFGQGGEYIRKFYDELETLWNDHIVGDMQESALGPVVKVPTIQDAWLKVYTTEKLESFKKLFDQAEAAVAGNPEELERVRYVRKNILDVIIMHSRAYHSSDSLRQMWQLVIPGRAFLKPLAGGLHESMANVTVSEDQNNFIFLFNCREKVPFAQASGLDNESIFSESHVELFLNPSGDRKNYLHLAVSARGTLYDSLCTPDGTDKKFASQAQCQANLTPEGWSAQITLPKKVLGDYVKTGFPVNFAFTAGNPQEEGIVNYQWNVLPDTTFHNVSKYGLLIPQESAPQELISNWDFQLDASGRAPGWFLWRQFPARQTSGFDRRDYIAGGAALRLENREPGKVLNATAKIALQPGKNYRLSFDMKTDLQDVPGNSQFGADVIVCQAARGYKLIHFPFTTLRGKNPWRRYSVDFQADKYANPQEAELVLWLRGDVGTVYFDRVSLIELP